MRLPLDFAILSATALRVDRARHLLNQFEFLTNMAHGWGQIHVRWSERVTLIPPKLVRHWKKYCLDRWPASESPNRFWPWIEVEPLEPLPDGWTTEPDGLKKYPNVIPLALNDFSFKGNEYVDSRARGGKSVQSESGWPTEHWYPDSVHDVRKIKVEGCSPNWY